MIYILLSVLSANFLYLEQLNAQTDLEMTPQPWTCIQYTVYSIQSCYTIPWSISNQSPYIILYFFFIFYIRSTIASITWTSQVLNSISVKVQCKNLHTKCPLSCLDGLGSKHNNLIMSDSIGIVTVAVSQFVANSVNSLK